ncbi:MAG: DUF429 domain-containing protein [Desulfurococcus sp.]|jgi:predicted nuclease with RNAse H fold|uniref:DUF429 domain-containing protein n=1 Tax=Desulfurococcus sp. TaxID=51678 RepID=UPI003165632D
MVIYAGIDLAGSPRNPTGVALIKHNGGARIVFIGVLYSDGEIIDLLGVFKPNIVALDAPLTPGHGYREVDLLLLNNGYRVLPPGWRGMRLLYERAVRLTRILCNMGIKVVETHPRSALKSSGCRNIYELVGKLSLPARTGLTRDEEDALIASIVAMEYARGEAVSFKAPDGEIFLLKPLCG